MSDRGRETNMERVEVADGLFIRTASNPDRDSVEALVFEVLREYGLKPDPDGVDADLDDIEGKYLERGGAFELIEDADGNLLGTVGLFPVDGETVELRKMYFAKALRGRGIGKLTLQRMIATARQLGYARLVLETASVLKEAIGLYTSFGFRDIPGAHSDRCDRAFFIDL